jgi:hypothetical protein
MRPSFGVALVALLAAVTARADVQDWETRWAMPLPRTEVAAAAVRGEIVVLGGLTIDAKASRRVDA